MEHNNPYATIVYKHPNEFPADVAELFNANSPLGIENSPTWLSNFIDTVCPNDPGVSIFVLRKNGSAVAALPLRVTTKWFGQKVDSLSNYYTALFTPITSKLTTDSDMAALVKSVCASNPHLISLQLSPMDLSAASSKLIWRACRTNGLVPMKFFCFGNWYLSVHQPWHDYLLNRDGVVRNTIKRMGNKFSRAGGTISLIQGDPNLEHNVAAYLQVYASSWKTPEVFDRFVPGLIRACAAKGWLRLGIAWLNNKPIAAQFWIVCDGRASIFKLAYDQEYKSFAPGTLLTAALMEQVLEHDKVVEVDYLIGDDAYKQLWMHERRERWGMIAYNSKNFGGALGLIKEAIGRAIKTMIRFFLNLLGTK